MKIPYFALGLCGVQAFTLSLSLFLSRCANDRSWEAHWAQSRTHVLERTNYWRCWRPTFFLPTLRSADRQCLEAWIRVMSVGPVENVTANRRKAATVDQPRLLRCDRTPSSSDNQVSCGSSSLGVDGNKEKSAKTPSTSLANPVSSRFFFSSMLLQDSLIQLIGVEELRNFYSWWSRCFYAVEPMVYAIRREKQGDAVLLHVKTRTALICRVPFTSYTFQCCNFPSFTTLVLEDLPDLATFSLRRTLFAPFRLLFHFPFPGVPAVSGGDSVYDIPSAAETASHDRLWKVWRWKCWQGPTHRVITSVEHHWFGGRMWSAQTGSVSTPWGDMGDLARRSTGYVLSTLLASTRWMRKEEYPLE